MGRKLDEFAMRQASIFELRNIAREMGVLSPTLYKKDVLIEKILKIINGEEKPQMPKSRQGRPPKNSFNTNGYVGETGSIPERVVTFDDYMNNSSLYGERRYKFEPAPSRGGEWLLASPGFVYGKENSLEEEEPVKAKGYFMFLENMEGYVFETGQIKESENIIFVPHNFIKAYNLISGDYITYKYKTLETKNTCYLCGVDTINGVKEINHDRPEFEKLEMSSFNSKQNFLSCNNKFKILQDTCVGTRNIVLSSSLRDYLDLLKSFKPDENTCGINLCLDTLPEEDVVFKNLNNIESFYTIVGDSEKQVNITVNLAIERAKRLAENNKNVVLFVNDIRKLIKYKNFHHMNNFEDLKNKSLDTCYLIMSATRNLKLGNNITVYAMFKTDKKGDFYKIVYNELDNMNCNFYNID